MYIEDNLLPQFSLISIGVSNVIQNTSKYNLGRPIKEFWGFCATLFETYNLGNAEAAKVGWLLDVSWQNSTPPILHSFN